MERIRSVEIYQGRVINLRQDVLRTAEGKELHRDVVVHPGAVVVLPVHQGDLLFVKQYRYAAGEALLELPAGTLEPGEDPASTAARELQEEVGYKADKLTLLCDFFSAPGFCNELLHLYVAEELTESKLPGDEDEQIEVIRLPLAEAVKLAVSGQLRDAKTLVGVLLYAQRTQRG